jgi:hypothetical protein
MKKDFKDKTKLGKFLSKVTALGLDVAPIIKKASTGNIIGAIGDTVSLLKGEDTTESKELLDEFVIQKKNIELDFYRAEAQDRDSARNREIEVAKVGKIDYMMYATGITGLLSFIFMIYAVVYIPSVLENDLFLHLLGMVEGVVISNIFAYYYGTSAEK